jgi:hypothetical protein
VADLLHIANLYPVYYEADGGMSASVVADVRYEPTT